MQENVEEVVQALSAAIAPVFLLSGIGALMSSGSLRYSRKIDRIRTLLREGNVLYRMAVSQTYVEQEIDALVKRAKGLRLSLMMMAFSMFSVSFTILVIFAEIILRANVVFLVETGFLVSILTLMFGVGLFMQDYASSLKAIELDISVRMRSATEKPNLTKESNT